MRTSVINLICHKGLTWGSIWVCVLQLWIWFVIRDWLEVPSEYAYFSYEFDYIMSLGADFIVQVCYSYLHLTYEFDLSSGAGFWSHLQTCFVHLFQQWFHGHIVWLLNFVRDLFSRFSQFKSHLYTKIKITQFLVPTSTGQWILFLSRINSKHLAVLHVTPIKPASKCASISGNQSAT